MKKIIAAALIAVATASVFAGPAEDALAAAKNEFNSFTKGDVKSIFTGLPASYQKDVSSVVVAFANKFDAEMFTGIMDAVGAIADFGIAKAGLIAEIFEDDEDIPNAVAIKSLAGKLTLDTLKKGDVAGVLANPESAVIARLFTGRFSKIEIVSSRLDDDGIVSVTAKNADGEPSDIEYSKIEGVWVSEIFYEDWETNIKGVLGEIAAFDMNDTRRQRVLRTMPTIKSIFKNAQKSKNAEQLHQNLLTPLTELMMAP